MLVVGVACGNGSSPDNDASVGDSGGVDVHAQDVGPTDSSATDATDATSATDATDDASDGSQDATNDTSSDDGSTDASDDASDSSVVDAGDGGKKKGCLGVFCIIGDKCCNNMASVDYGKCEPTTCTTCCL